MTTLEANAWQTLSSDPADPSRILDWLDLTQPGLEAVAAAVAQGDQPAALAALLNHYRQRHGYWYDTHSVLGIPALDSETHEQRATMISRADDTLRHVLLARADMLALGYQPHDYGPNIDWCANPHDNVVWAATIHRFNWDQPLAYAYAATGDERYAQGWVRLARDWFHKMRPQRMGLDGDRPKYEGVWFGYSALQVGVRSQRLPASFELYKHAACFTPDALADFFAMVHDAASKTARTPELSHSNPTIIEAEGLLRLALMFPEFREAPIWRSRALAILEDTFRIQVTPDGVQAEWGINYHIACTTALVRIVSFLDHNQQPVPAWMRNTMHRMFDHTLASVSPDRLYPMFSDARRPSHAIEPALKQASEVTGDPRYAAVLDENAANHPAKLNYAFPQAGFYFFRSSWRRDAIYMAVHCSPPARSKHDQPDNGTFELHAHGRWVMPDSGCYAYDHRHAEAALRPWFRATAHHQTLTLNDADTTNAARHLMWVDQPGLAVAAFENASYPQLTHRRTIFFVEGRFFVLLDEALGDAQGDLKLHFQLEPGPALLDTQRRLAATQHSGEKNVLVACSEESQVDMVEEEGWTSSQYHQRVERPAFCFCHRQAAPAAFVTVIVPFTGQKPPAVRAHLIPDFTLGSNRAEIEVRSPKTHWHLTRDLASGEADCIATH